MQGDICPICNEGFLSEHFEQNNGLMFEYCVCSYCGTEQVDSEQSKRNKLRKQEWSITVGLKNED